MILLVLSNRGLRKLTATSSKPYEHPGNTIGTGGAAHVQGCACRSLHKGDRPSFGNGAKHLDSRLGCCPVDSVSQETCADGCRSIKMRGKSFSKLLRKACWRIIGRRCRPQTRDITGQKVITRWGETRTQADQLQGCIQCASDVAVLSRRCELPDSSEGLRVQRRRRNKLSGCENG